MLSGSEEAVGVLQAGGWHVAPLVLVWPGQMGEEPSGPFPAGHRCAASGVAHSCSPGCCGSQCSGEKAK